MFEKPYTSPRQLPDQSDRLSARNLARDVAKAAVVLLKNNGAAPLSAKPGDRIAVIGPNAEEPLFGGYSDAPVGGGVEILDGIRRAAPRVVVVEYAEGVWITPQETLGRHRSYAPIGKVPLEENRARIAKAVEVAARSDVVILVVGEVPALTREAVDPALPGDRDTLDLWGQQNELVDALAAVGKPIVALLLCGRPLTVPNLVAKVQTLFMGWYFGEEGGSAFAKILFGRSAPSGKLTVTMPKSVGDVPVYYDRHPSADGNHYLETESKALFPFGHGLSYTRFEMSPPRLRSASMGPYEGLDLEFDVSNIGGFDGAEVVQIYIRDLVSSVPRPVLKLKAFRRVFLRQGERRTVSFRLEADAFAMWDVDMNRVVEPGDFFVYAGPNSVELK